MGARVARGGKVMRTINLLGLEYTEEMIDMLVKFDKHMNNKFAEKMVKGDLLTMDDIETEREAYIEKLDEHEGLVVKHFVSASFLNKQNPIMGMLPSIPAIRIPECPGVKSVPDSRDSSSVSLPASLAISCSTSVPSE